MKSASFLRSSHRGVVRVDRPWTKGLRYVTMPRNSWSSVTFVVAGRACTASTFSGFGGHHWHHIGSQRSLWLGPLHVFSVDWTQLHTCGLPAWGSADGHYVPPQYNHMQWCHQWFWYIWGTLQGTGPYSSGWCLVNRPDQREDAGNSTSQRGCWR